MDYKISVNNFEGPFDLLLHLIKQSNIDICDISIVDITNQYLDYINKMEELNLDIASEYLVMAAELIEIKSSILLPKPELSDSEYEEDPREKLINKLLDYQQYKEMTSIFKDMESDRKGVFTKEPSDLKDYGVDLEPKLSENITITNLIDAFNKFLDNRDKFKPLNTKITSKEYSVSKRNTEIRNLIKTKKRIEFSELFDIFSKEYIVVTFLSILDLTRKQEVELKQDNNFDKIYISEKVNNEL